MMSELLQIDGSILEGGGQILRTSISLSAILRVPIRVYNIRAGRSKPGLAAQHLKGIQLVAQMCQAKLSGDTIGSTCIEFRPGKLRAGTYEADTRTAGSISLVLQVALPCALAADGPVALRLRGGTNVAMAPQLDYITEVFRPNLNKFGAHFTFDIHRRGYYPKGGGEVTVQVTPVRVLRPVSLLTAGRPTQLKGWSYVSGTLPVKLSFEMAEGVKERLNDSCEIIDIECYKEDQRIARDNSSGIIISMETSSGCVLGADGLGRRGVAAADVGRAVADELAQSVGCGACLDTRAQDQVIIYMALAEGRSAVRCGGLTLHTRTAIHVTNLIAKTEFNVQENGDHTIVECVGLAHTNPAMR